MRRPLVLDFDASVVGMTEARVVPLRELQESIRFACSLRQLQALVDGIEQPLDDNSGVVMLGSGDFHHLSFALIERVARFRPVEVIVLDNHPDNMRWLGGIHCGSWVRHVARLRNVIHVHVLGITSPDISSGKLWENYFTPLLRGRLTYWSVGQTPGWMHRLRWHGAFRNFATPAQLCAAFAREQANAAHPVYFSIDKDVLSPTLVACNWDQGCFTEQHIESVLQAVQGRVIASDITGELSEYRYRTNWKRWISARDAQPVVDPRNLALEQDRHRSVNLRLVARIDQAMGVPAARSSSFDGQDFPTPAGTGSKAHDAHHDQRATRQLWPSDPFIE